MTRMLRTTTITKTQRRRRLKCVLLTSAAQVVLFACFWQHVASERVIHVVDDGFGATASASSSSASSVRMKRKIKAERIARKRHGSVITTNSGDGQDVQRKNGEEITLAGLNDVNQLNRFDQPPSQQETKRLERIPRRVEDVGSSMKSKSSKKGKSPKKSKASKHADKIYESDTYNYNNNHYTFHYYFANTPTPKVPTAVPKGKTSSPDTPNRIPITTVPPAAVPQRQVEQQQNLFAPGTDPSDQQQPPFSLNSVFRQGDGSCKLQSTGFFGSINTNPLTVSFNYQATIEAGVDYTLASQEIFPLLDRGIVEGILPSFFSCNNTSGRRLQTPTIIGVSSRPDDLVSSSSSIPCTGLAPGDCYTFQGLLTVFAENMETDDDADTLVRPAIQNFVDSGSLQKLDYRILGVNYLSRQSNGTLVDATPISTPVPTPPRPTTMRPTVVMVPTLPPVEPGETSAPTSPKPLPGVPTVAPSSPGQPVSGGTTAPVIPGGSSTKEPTNPGVGPTIQTRQRGNSAMDKIEWWHWLLIGIGGSFILLVCCKMCGDSNRRGAVPIPSKDKAPEGPGNADTYDPPAADDYVPPGIGTRLGQSLGSKPPADFSTSPAAIPAVSPPPSIPRPAANGDEYYGEAEEEDDHFDDEDEGEDGGDEDFDDGEGSYQEGEEAEEGGDFEDGEDEDGEGEYDEDGEGEFEDGEGEFEDGEGEFEDEDGEGEFEEGEEAFERNGEEGSYVTDYEEEEVTLQTSEEGDEGAQQFSQSGSARGSAGLWGTQYRVDSSASQTGSYP